MQATNWTGSEEKKWNKKKNKTRRKKNHVHSEIR